MTTITIEQLKEKTGLEAPGIFEQLASARACLDKLANEFT